MKKRASMCVAAVTVLFSGVLTLARAQTPQIPTLQVCNKSQVTGEAKVKIDSRQDGTHLGVFTVSVKMVCNAPHSYPNGSVSLEIDMEDSTINGGVGVHTFHQMTTTGKYSPTAYINGECTVENIRGCRIWLMFADNKEANDVKGTPDVIGFLIVDGTGKRMAYGTGPVISGDIEVADTPN